MTRPPVTVLNNIQHVIIDIPGLKSLIPIPIPLLFDLLNSDSDRSKKWNHSSLADIDIPYFQCLPYIHRTMFQCSNFIT